MTTITTPRKRILNTLDERGWIQGSWGTDTDGPVCLHGAIRLCDPQDATLIEQVWQARGYGTDWNDASGTTLEMVKQYVLDASPITDRELEEVFGPQWREVVALIRRVSRLTRAEVEGLARARSTAWNAAWNEAVWAARIEAEDDTVEAAADAIENAAVYGTVNGTMDAVYAAGNTVEALVARGLIGDRFTQAHYDLLTGPWRTGIGPVHPDDALLSVEGP